MAGALVLAAWFGRYWPGTPWTVLPGEQLITKGRQFAKLFGRDVDGWEPYTVATVSNSLAHNRIRSPLALRITFAPRGGPSAEVGFDSSGRPVYWRAPVSEKSARRAPSIEADAARAAFQIMAGPEAGAYKDAGHFMGRDVDDEDYSWRKQSPAHSDLRDTITVATKGSAVTRVERKVYLASDQDDDLAAVDSSGYWDIFGGVFGVLSVAGCIVVISIYALWLARKAINHQFPLRLAGVALAIMLLVMRFGADWQKSHSLSKHQDLLVVSTLFVAAILLAAVAVGRGISQVARPRWMSLEQLCLLAPVSRTTGQSVAAGLLFSPLLAAIPFLIVGSGFPRAWVLPQGMDVLYSRAPLLDSLDVRTGVYLIGFFGFAVPALERWIRLGWLRTLILLPLGTVFFAYLVRVVAGPIAAPLTAGFLTLTLFWFVWARFDLLALLTVQFASCWVMSICILAQKGGAFWSPLSGLAGLLLSSLWLQWRGKEAVEGDPMATLPTLTGFRAEREKLQAEFSLARRAQQDMLPPTPEIPGYSMAASCTPSLEVGGDLYDFLLLPDGRIGIGVADVSGKGVPAALYMTLTKGLLTAVTKSSSQLIPVIEEVNRHLHGVTRKKVFVTMALGFLDIENRMLQCVRAGHNPVVWRQAVQGQTKLVSPGGLGLGITASRVFSTQLEAAEMNLSEGDAVVFYSDGITEAMNRDLELFGEQRLMDAVSRTDNLDAAETRDSILKEVTEFLGGIHPQDDMTLVVLRVGLSGKLARNAVEMRG